MEIPPTIIKSLSQFSTQLRVFLQSTLKENIVTVKPYPLNGQWTQLSNWFAHPSKCCIQWLQGNSLKIAIYQRDEENIILIGLVGVVGARNVHCVANVLLTDLIKQA